MPPASPKRAIFGVLAVTAALTVLVAATGADLSASRFLHDDLLVRGAPAAEPVPYRYLDASPWAIWVPSDVHVRDSFLGGGIADWNRMQGGGYSPLLAFYNGVLSPLRLLTALVPERVAPGLLIVWSAALMLVGGLWLGHRLGLSPLAALAGAAVLTGSPMMMGMWAFDYGLVLLFLPVLSAAGLDAIRKPTFGRAALLATLSGLSFTSGHPSMIFLTHLFAGLVVAC